MITAIMAVVGWIAKHWVFVAKWFGVAIGKLISNAWVLAGLSIFALASWSLADWDGICNGVSGYVDSVTSVVQAVHINTGVQWIDGFIGFFALDTFASSLVAFVAFFLPLVAAVLIGVFVSVIGFTLKLIVYKMTASATRDLAK